MSRQERHKRIVAEAVAKANEGKKKKKER